MFSTLAEAQAIVGNAQFPGMDALLSRLVHQSANGAPSSVVPAFIGQMYLDTGSNAWYVSYGLSAGNWTACGLGGLDATELGYLDGTTPGAAVASKALVPGAGALVDTLDITTLKNDGRTLSPLIWVDVAVTAALLDSAGTVAVVSAATGDSFKVRDIILVGGGTNFGSGGNRLISLTDGTTVYTTIANADIESAPAASLRWGDTKVPLLTSTSNTATVAGQALRFAYSGGTTDHSATGSINFSVCLQKVA